MIFKLSDYYKEGDLIKYREKTYYEDGEEKGGYIRLMRLKPKHPNKWWKE